MNQFTYVVTGAASGIGRCTAKTLAKAQHHLILIDIQKEALQDTCQELQELDPHKELTLTPLCCDLSNPEELVQLQETLTKIDCLTGVIHSAGLLGEYARCHELPLAQFDLVMKHQFYSAYYTAHACLPKFCENKGGSMVFVGGVGGLVALAHLPAYTAALHAVSGLVKALALDYGKDNIRVNGVLPAATHTPMYKKAQGNHPQLSRSGSLTKTAVPLSKIASAKEVSDVIVFLLSEQASHISGALLPIDGGFTTY